jgi:hypothetical protein
MAIFGSAIALALASPAQAATYLFSITGDYTASFKLASSPTPDFVDPGNVFAVAKVPGFADSSNGFADITFFSGAFAGLLISDNGDNFTWLLDAVGPQLYTGDEAAPTFKTGAFALTGLGTPGAFTLRIAAVPEPETWGLMIVGLGLAGAAMRRGKPRVSVRYAVA